MRCWLFRLCSCVFAPNGGHVPVLSLLSTYIILEDFGPRLPPPHLGNKVCEPEFWKKAKREESWLTAEWAKSLRTFLQLPFVVGILALCPSWTPGSSLWSRTRYWSLFETQLKCFITFITLYCNFIQAWGQKLYVGHLNITKHSA